MSKLLIVGITVLSFSQAAMANRADILKCIDKNIHKAKPACVANTFNKEIKSDKFFGQLADKKISLNRNALASVTYYPNRNLIEVKSLEAFPKTLLASN